MEKVVYFLGAGFSAPLGIPVMKNFFEKSKDMYFNDKVKYKHFIEVIDTFNEYNLIKSFYDSNLFNIEELLSILEIGEKFQRSRLKQIFLNYISDVIKFYTYPLKYEYLSLTNAESAFDQAKKWKNHIKFIASLLGLEFNLETITLPEYGTMRLPRFYKSQDCNFNYNIISLNYDTVIEECINYLNNFSSGNRLRISRLPSDKEKYPCDIYLAKLHGSIDDKTIVPPTWNKSLRSEIRSYWKLASQLLKEANHIRFIGYSLPDSDAYVRYLLKSSITTKQHLKSIDVICYDHDGSVKNRYDQFIVFPNYRFISEKTEKYLEDRLVTQRSYERGGAHLAFMSYTVLEDYHKRFMEKATI